MAQGLVYKGGGWPGPWRLCADNQEGGQPVQGVVAGEVRDARPDEEPAKVGASAVGRRKERDKEKDYERIRDLIQEVVRIWSS